MTYRKYDSLSHAFESNVIHSGADECWEWRGCRDKDGYGVIQYQKKQYRVHRVSYLLRYGHCPDELDVCHTCDNPPCCNPFHLFLGTNLDNIVDRTVKGRSAQGERSARSKLTEADVLELREMASRGERTKDIANRFGITYAMIGAIARGDFWKHVGGPLTTLKLAGSRIGQSKLTESQVIEIRQLVAGGLGKGEMSRRFGVSRATIIRVCRFESWKHVGEL